MTNARNRCQATPMEGARPTTTNQHMEMTILRVAVTRTAAVSTVGPRGSRRGEAQEVRGKYTQEPRWRAVGSELEASSACSSMRRARTHRTTPVTTSSTKRAWAAVEPAKREVRGRVPPSESCG